EWLASGRPNSPDGGHRQPTVSELMLAFWDYVEQHYRHPDGTPTSEVKNFRDALRPLRHAYGKTKAREFGPLALKAVREMMIHGWVDPDYGPRPGLARGVINRRIGRIRRMFKWAVENELVPRDVLFGLQAVTGLQRGRSAAKETAPVGPVSFAVVEQTLPR